MPHMRPINVVISAALQRRHWRALYNSFIVYEKPIIGLYVYIIRPSSRFPRSLKIKTPTGPLSLKIHHPDDMMTINEVFCRGDYKPHPGSRIFVDFGSNIGISAAYFLTRHDSNFCYLFEPNPRNVERLEAQLESFAGRYICAPVGIAVEDGELEFGFEPSGRYGGAGLDHPDKRIVRVWAAERVLGEIIDKHGKIDVLKIDIESMEIDIIQSLSSKTLSRIELILVEHNMTSNILSRTHCFSREGPIARFTLK